MQTSPKKCNEVQAAKIKIKNTASPDKTNFADAAAAAAAAR